MRFGLMVPTFSFEDLDHAAAARIKDFAIRAEALGFDALWTAEHLLTAPGLYGVAWLSPLLCLAHMAAVTREIRIGTNILILCLRNPVMTAKEIATLDVLSGGRTILGVGVGWDRHEFEVAGVPFSERGGRTDEALALLRRLLTERRVTHRGRYYQVEDVTIDPRPRRPPPVWIAGGSKVKTALSPDPPGIAPSVLRRIAAADGWTARAAGTQESVKEDWRKIVEHCRASGRDPATLTFSHLNFLHLVPTRDREEALRIQRPYFERVMGTHRTWAQLQESYLAGTTADIVARIADLERAGLQHMVLCPLAYDLEQLERLASEIVVPFRGTRRAGA
jgi:probable F420-dependent oxidoreductase